MVDQDLFDRMWLNDKNLMKFALDINGNVAVRVIGITDPTLPSPPTVTLTGTDSGIHEVGETVSAPTFTAHTVKHTDDITLAQFYEWLTMEYDVPAPIAIGWTETYVSLADITSNEYRTCKVSDGILQGLSNTVSYTFIYPYFRWTVTGWSMPTADQTLLDSGNKVILPSIWDITVNFGSWPTDRIRFAIPATSTSKTTWFVDILNNWPIGWLTNLFGTEQVVNVDSPTALWLAQDYKFYIANYQSGIVVPMELKN